MKVLWSIIKATWSSFFKKDPVKEVEREAKKRVDKVADGQSMSDLLNKQLRDD